MQAALCLKIINAAFIQTTGWMVRIMALNCMNAYHVWMGASINEACVPSGGGAQDSGLYQVSIPASRGPFLTWVWDPAPALATQVWPAASVSSQNYSEMKISDPKPTPAQPYLHFNKTPGDSHMLKFQKGQWYIFWLGCLSPSLYAHTPPPPHTHITYTHYTSYSYAHKLPMSPPHTYSHSTLNFNTRYKLYQMTYG